MWKLKLNGAENGISRNTYTPVDSVVLQGYDNSRYTISGLLSYWNYRVRVATTTTVGPAPDTSPMMRRTVESTPSQVESLQVKQGDKDATKVTMTFTCPSEKARNGKLVKFVYNSSITTTQGASAPQGPQGEIQYSDICNFSKDLPVTAETNYTVSVHAVTDSGLTGNVSTATVSVKARAPTFLKNPATGLMSPTEKKSQTSVTVEIQRVIFNTLQGTVVIAGLLVCRQKGQQSCQRGAITGRQSDYYKDPSKTNTWASPAARDGGVYYRASPDDFLSSSGRSRRSAVSRSGRERRSTVIQFTIGINGSCADLLPEIYCNGPLAAGQQYSVHVFSCTSGGCSETTEPIVVKTVPEDVFPIAAVAGAIAAVVVAIIVAVIVVIVWRRRRRHRKNPSTPDDNSHGSMDESLEIPTIRKPVKLQDFGEHLRCLHKDANLEFQAEFEDIVASSPTFLHEAAILDANKVKNRYVNILPFDRTRVKLITDEDDATADYINASYIPGYSSPREYIATQGPMTSTVNDFWRMIWEQNSCLIVQLSDLQEKGRKGGTEHMIPKVDLYWPQEVNTPVQYGDIIITLTSLSTLNKYTIRNFSICMENNLEERRQVAQYFIHGWVDYSANLNPDDVMDFIRTVRLDAKKNPTRPITVHCSAGVGRTGTFIALDFLQQFVDDHALDDVVDIYNLVLNMRHNRPLMVQSESQYVFIHDTLKLIVDRKIRMMEDDDIYQNTLADENIYANQGFEIEENIYQNTGFGGADPTTAL
ncbi:hypothetical protein ACOMHN_019320 [Nucella lapillus]